jgi:hypothetical protein
MQGNMCGVTSFTMYIYVNICYNMFLFSIRLSMDEPG